MQLLGLDFADLTVAATADLLSRRPVTAPFGYVTTPNADHLVRMHRRPELLPLYQNAMLSLLDSRAVASAARCVGLTTPHVTPGSDLTALLLAQYVGPGERITIVGLSPRWLPALVERCGLAPPAHYDPPTDLEINPGAMQTAVEFVLAHPARFVFLAVGSPQQEMLAAAIQATGNASGTGLCIGSSLEFIAGAQQRAPQWMQHASLEWLYRLCCHPCRLARRYLIDSPTILPMLLRERLSVG